MGSASLTVKNLLMLKLSGKKPNNNIILKGWLKNKKKIGSDKKIYSINDGSTSKNIDVILSGKQLFFSAKLESPIIVEGKLCDNDQINSDEYCIEAERLKVIGKNESTFNRYLRSYKSLENFSAYHPNFRAKAPSFAAKLRVRSEVKRELHNYFQQEGFINVETPILTRYLRNFNNDILYLESERVPEGKNPVNYAFGHPVYLSTSGQLHLECISSGINKVYSMGPAFKVTESSGKYAYEFWKLECEEAFLAGKEGYEKLLKSTENLVKHTIKHVLENCKLDCMVGNRKLEEFGKKIENVPFPRISYTDAIKLFKENEDKLPQEVEFGFDYKITSQQLLVKHFDGLPVYVIDYPYYLMPFNIAAVPGTDLVMGFDLIMPDAGKLIRGGLREPNYDNLHQKLELFGGIEYFSWFLNMRKWGCAPTGGFSFGLERFLHFIFKESHINNVSAFPRSSNFCKC